MDYEGEDMINPNMLGAWLPRTRSTRAYNTWSSQPIRRNGSFFGTHHGHTSSKRQRHSITGSQLFLSEDHFPKQHHSAVKSLPSECLDPIDARVKTYKEEQKLSCSVFAAGYQLADGVIFVKITTVFTPFYDTMQNQLELRERVGCMELGKQIHEDCHYLEASHKENVVVKLSGLNDCWRPNCVAQDLKYKKMWDGPCMTSFNFQTPPFGWSQLFSANVTIYQAGRVKDATSFHIEEPVSKVIVPRAGARSSRHRQDGSGGSRTNTLS